MLSLLIAQWFSQMRICMPCTGSVCINAANKSIYEINETSLPTWWTESINWKKNSEQIWLYQIDRELCKPGNDANWTKKPFKYGQNNFLQELILYLFNNGEVSKKKKMDGFAPFFYLIVLVTWSWVKCFLIVLFLIIGFCFVHKWFLFR